MIWETSVNPDRFQRWRTVEANVELETQSRLVESHGLAAR